MAKGSKGAGKSLVRATIAIHEPPVGSSTTPGGLIKTFNFDFNPSQLQLSRLLPVEVHAGRGRA